MAILLLETNSTKKNLNGIAAGTVPYGRTFAARPILLRSATALPKAHGPTNASPPSAVSLKMATRSVQSTLSSTRVPYCKAHHHQYCSFFRKKCNQIVYHPQHGRQLLGGVLGGEAEIDLFRSVLLGICARCYEQGGTNHHALGMSLQLRGPKIGTTFTRESNLIVIALNF